LANYWFEPTQIWPLRNGSMVESYLNKKEFYINEKIKKKFFTNNVLEILDFYIFYLLGLELLSFINIYLDHFVIDVQFLTHFFISSTIGFHARI
jgi:hypothetical protein